MTLLGLLTVVVIVVVLGLVAHWLISRFLPEPARQIAYVIVGLLLLLYLLYSIFPSIGNTPLLTR